MAHTLQDRYSKLVDAKLRATLVTRDGLIFNTRYEGKPTAGAVKIPVRDTEVAVREYDKASGIDAQTGTTTYLTVTVDKDYAVNELIDGYDAAAVPDGIVAERLDSAGYSFALQLDKDAIATLEAGGTVYGDTTAIATETAYTTLVGMRTQLSKSNVPASGRFALVTPDVVGMLLEDTTHFVRASNLGDEVVQSGAIGRIAGFTVYETNNAAATTEIIVGHPDWCHRIREWAVDVHLQDLNGSGKYIGASAVQGRSVYTHKVSKKAAVLIKKKA